MRLSGKSSDPLVLDRWVDVAYIVMWSILSFWGVAALVVGMPAFNILTPRWYFLVWGGAIGMFGFIAAIAATLVFYETRVGLVVKLRVELAAIYVLCSFIFVYPALLTILVMAGDTDRIVIAGLSWIYLIFPLLRIHMLRSKVKDLEVV